MNIIKARKLFYIISLLVIIPGLISLLTNGLLLGIDFTGGSRLTVGFEKNTDIKQVEEAYKKQKINVHTTQKVNEYTLLIRSDQITEKQKNEVVKSVSGLSEKSFETVGATIGSETTQKAALAVVIASLAITGYIAYAFREVSKPLSSWKYGVAAIVALLHDVLLVIGVFSLLGYFFKVEIDSLFITALLTVMGFSVHDTIVVFDRIRESLKKSSGEVPFDILVNNSILETFNRSLNTSITVILVLVALLLFGGESIRWFVVALLIGILSGTYSSIFNASPLLVDWNNWSKKRGR